MIVALVHAPSAVVQAQSVYGAESPNKMLSISLVLDGGRPVYRVTYRGRTVVNDSPLGLVFKDGPPLAERLGVVDTTNRVSDETWTPVAGPRRTIPNRFSEVSVSLQEAAGERRRISIILRAFDEGVAFRYEMPAQPSLQSFVLASEATGYVVFEAPLAMVWGYPEAYRGQNGIEFIERVPTTWDETKVLHGAVGEFVAIARRQGDTWYMGGITNWDARDVSLLLAFVGPGNYIAEMFADGPDADVTATSLLQTRTIINARSVLNLHMAPGGGFAIILTPVTER